MTERAPSSTDVNSTASVASAIFLGTVGVLSFIVQPGLVQGFVSTLGMSDARADDVVGIEMMGVALATVVVAMIGTRVDWRALTLGMLITAVVGNLASATWLNQAPFVIARFIAGFGHGGVISLSFTFVGLTVRTDRNLALYLVALLSYGAFGLWVLPTVLTHVGFSPVFLFFAAVTALGLATLRWLPRSSHGREEVSPTALQLSKLWISIALAGVLAYNLAQGIAWANLSLIGTAANIGEQTVANDLFLSQILAVAGALLSVVLAGKVGRGQLVAGGIVGGALFIALLIGRPGPWIFLIAVCGFNFLWNFVLPFILGTVGDFDLHGRVITGAVAMQMIGLGLGPILSGGLMGAHGFLQIEIACVGFFAASLVLLVAAMAAHHRALARR